MNSNEEGNKTSRSQKIKIYNQYKNKKIVWWKRFLLFFVREQKNTKFYYKKLGKTTYILRERNECNNVRRIL